MTRDFLVKWLLSVANSTDTHLFNEERERLRLVAGQMVEDGREIERLKGEAISFVNIDWLERRVKITRQDGVVQAIDL